MKITARSLVKWPAALVSVILIAASFLATAASYDDRIYSSELGWIAGADVSNEFKRDVENRFNSGDTLVLDARYVISGSNLVLPSGFTLTAIDGGGLDVVTTAKDSEPLFVAANGVKIDNVKFDAVTAPETGSTSIKPKIELDFHRKTLIRVVGDQVAITNSSFTGNVVMFIEVRNAKNFELTDSRLEGGFYQVRLLGSSDDAIVLRTQFLNSLGDGIKTESSDGAGPQRTQVIDSQFIGNNRDGIDTAGGFKDGRVRDTTFRDNQVSGIDIKSGYDDASDLNPNKQNDGIVISGCSFIDNPNGIVVTVINRNGVLNDSNAELMPHDIQILDSVFENTGRPNTATAFLVKDGYDITWDNIQLVGNVVELRLQNREAPELSGTNVTGSSFATDVAARTSHWWNSLQDWFWK